jgi:V8-like Glu-specific endopeptidase
MRYLLKIALVTMGLALVVGGSFQVAQAKVPPGPGDVGGEPPPCVAAEQIGDLPFHREPYGVYSGEWSDGGIRTASVFRQVVRVPGAPWLRLHFGDYDLGDRNYITMTSLKDGSRQRLNATTIRQWGGSSAFFNGEAVEVELYVAPGEEGVFFRIEEVTVGERLGEAGALLSPQAGVSLCDGDDDRTASTDPSVGRLATANVTPCPVNTANCNPICTAWIGSNGALMTAGHCVDWDPDGFGAGLPDGVLDLDADDIVEFNVPSSLADGTPQFANADDQYTVVPGTFLFNFDGEGQGLGKDWAVFGVNPNPNTGLLPQHAQGPGAFYRLTREYDTADSSDGALRVTGCGVDDVPTGSGGGRNADNQTLQTDTGSYEGESSSGADFWHEHRADTTGASSGSPMIWGANGFAIGIHTNAGCTSTGGANAGTSFEHNPLENALQDFPGSGTVYVDGFDGWNAVITPPPQDGSIFRPYDLVIEGRDNVPVGGIVSIVAGVYSPTLTIDTAMTLVAPVGHVTIGGGQ